MRRRRREDGELTEVLKEQFTQILTFSHYLLIGGDEIMTEF